MKNQVKNRTVAIVGRPNVGKSSIFNRLTGRHTAIVHEESGVTRDRLVQEVQWQGQRFDLIDTGGLGKIFSADNGKGFKQHQIEVSIQRQIEVALEDSSVIIFVTDIVTGIVPQDQEIAEFLHKTGRPVFLAANKADNMERESGETDFEQFGVPVFSVSALHGRGFEPLIKAVLQSLPETHNQTAVDPLKVTIAGRPNVGKSSFINRLLNSDRVIVSEVPGTTRDSIDIPFAIGKNAMARHYILTDTAGIRRVGKIRNHVDRLGLSKARRSIARSDVAVLVLDALQGPTAQDKKIASLIQFYHKGCVLLVNKWDIVNGTTCRQYRTALNEALPFLDFVPVVFCSAKTGFNIRKTIEAIDAVSANNIAQLPTGILNRTIIEATKKVQPSVVNGKRLKIYYATQVSSKPIAIMLFVNYPASLKPAYASYLVKSIRRVFGLEGAPILLQQRARRKVARS